MNKNQMNPPEPGRLIFCKGEDWSPFTCYGKMVAYKPGGPKKLKGKARFFRQMPNGEFELDRETWKDITHWEYIQASTERNKE